VFTTQSFSSWLSSFLKRPAIDDALIAGYQLHHSRPTATSNDSVMDDIQDSPGWRDLGGFRNSPYDLIFGIYIDWFNPNTNRIAGVFHCLRVHFAIIY
jgi:hypothetical protein